MLAPTTLFLVIWLTINALQLFDEIFVTTKGGPVGSTTVVVYYLYQQAFQFFNGGYASAIAFVLFVAILVITVIQLTVGRRLLALGALTDDAPRSRRPPLVEPLPDDDGPDGARRRRPSPWHFLLLPLSLVMLTPLVWMVITAVSTDGGVAALPAALPELDPVVELRRRLDRLAVRALAAQHRDRFGHRRDLQPRAVQHGRATRSRGCGSAARDSRSSCCSPR